MTDRPILFSAPMVRALLAGTKTQTRRVVKGAALDWLSGPSGFNAEFVALPENGLCPYGKPGDRLWVRETWSPDPPCDGTWGYTAWSGCREGQIAGVPERFRHKQHCIYAATWDHDPIRWTPSIHMPRWASRITLEVTGVRVERLQDISEADARSEGAPPSHPSIDRISREFGYADFPRSWYGQLWESINGPGSWDLNPWVWVVEFKGVAQ